MASNKMRQHKNYELAMMDSLDWDTTREKVLRRDGYLCRACLGNIATEIHRNEEPDDALYNWVSVCPDCHKKIHGRL
jgi:5-methylcytosine-specific restriction endonuclease McrA